jgi:hypothetical protein
MLTLISMHNLTIHKEVLENVNLRLSTVEVWVPKKVIRTTLKMLETQEENNGRVQTIFQVLITER